jgi:carbonic anhydrase
MKLINRAVLATAFVLSPFVIATGHAAEEQHGHEKHWTYEGEGGPKEWGDLKDEFSTCKIGQHQSPIDIKKAEAGKKHYLDFNYVSSPLKIINNGHTIQANYAPGSSISLDGGKKYELLQFHFHTPSEHTVGGKSYPLEVHLVHKNAEGKLAVVGIFLKPGKKNDFIQTLWDNLPDKVGEEKVVDSVQINATDLVPHDVSHHHYAGSLTTPPCTEGVSWTVMTTPIEASKEQIAKYKSLFKISARPVQPLHGRKIEGH